MGPPAEEQRRAAAGAAPGTRPRDWDGTTYDRVSDPLVRWGAAVVDRLRLRGDEWVVDAGCGSGRVTEQLLRLLPRGRVIALDASPRMLVEAGRRLAPFGSQVDLLCADLGRELPLGRPVDAVFSTATFHWLPDHEGLFRRLRTVLRPGGQLVAQCGGAGCIATVEAAIRRAWPRAAQGGAQGGDWPGLWNFATAEETAERLRRAGYSDVCTWLHDEPTAIEAGAPLETYLRTVILGAHLDRLAPEEREPFVRAVAAGLPDPRRPVLDYVRLNIVARRPDA
jgi:trans-aconitate 2-methyltransferase